MSSLHLFTAFFLFSSAFAGNCVTLYEDGSLGGYTLYGCGYDNWVGHHFNDELTSVMFHCSDCHVILYDDANYGGKYLIHNSDGDGSWFNVPGWFNDVCSSFKVKSGKSSDLPSGFIPNKSPIFMNRNATKALPALPPMIVNIPPPKIPQNRTASIVLPPKAVQPDGLLPEV